MAFESLCTDAKYIAYVLDGAKAQYVSLPDDMKQGFTLEEFQAREILSRCLK